MELDRPQARGRAAHSAVGDDGVAVVVTPAGTELEVAADALRLLHAHTLRRLRAAIH